MDNEKTSLNKYISSSGFCSRREADKLIEQARVTINGELVVSAISVYPGDVVEIDGEPIHKTKKRPIYIAFNKPVGVTSTTDVKDRSNIIYFINHTKRIFPIGRLDKDSDGLIFLTNDGDIVNKILRASNHHEKEYVVNVDKAVTPEFIKQMGGGIPMLGTVTNKCYVRQEGSRRFRIMLTQGLNRQIRRMCEYLDYKVVSLTRVRIMNVTLDTLAVGKWRYLTLAEINKLNEMVAESSKTDSKHGRAKPKKIKPVAEPEEEYVEPVMPDRKAGGSNYKKEVAGKGKKEERFGKPDVGYKKDVPVRGKKEGRIGKPDAGYKKEAPVRGKKESSFGKSKIPGRNKPGTDTKNKKAPVRAGNGASKPAHKPKTKETFSEKQTQNVKQYIPRKKKR